jgi:hypothetical protein
MTLADNANDDFGKFCSHDISGNSFGFAFYEATGADLVYLEYNIVTSYTAQVDIDTSDEVGEYCSLKFNSGVPGISYYDAEYANLKYATEGSPYWNVQTVDNSGDDVGKYSSLDYDGSGNPSIAYYEYTYGYVRWARWDSVRSRWYIASLVGGTGEDWGQYMSHQWYGSTKCGFAFQGFDANGSWQEFVLWTPGGGGGGNYEADATTDCGMYSSFAWVTAGGNAGDGWISHYETTNGRLRYTFVND